MLRHNDYYVLGFNFSDATVKDGQVKFTKGKEGRQVLSDIAALVSDRGGFVKLAPEGRNFTLTIEDKNFLEVFTRLVDDKRRMPRIPEEYAWSFVCGFFDAYGSFRFDASNPRILIKSPHLDVIDLVIRLWSVKTPHADKVQAHGYKALDVCGRMYENTQLRNEDNYSSYLDVLNWVPARGWAKTEPFQFCRLDPKALAPVKTRATDSGFDIHAISMTRVAGDVYKAETGLAVKPAPGLCFDLIGRSSLPKRGWTFLQGVGIIDRSYRGALSMHMRKLWPEVEMPKMPWKCMQIVPRSIVHTNWLEVKSFELESTDRGVSGFGSTDG